MRMKALVGWLLAVWILLTLPWGLALTFSPLREESPRLFYALGLPGTIIILGVLGGGFLYSLCPTCGKREDGPPVTEGGKRKREVVASWLFAGCALVMLLLPIF